MGVTAIKSIANRVNGAPYHVRNLERPSDTGGEGNYLVIYPGENRAVNMWIPWCNNQEDFTHDHRITFEALGSIEQEVSGTIQRRSVNPDSYTIWQRGDHVYFSVEDTFQSGQLVWGNSTVNGDRSVEITVEGVRFY